MLDGALSDLLTMLQQSGPAGAIVASVIVGLVLAVIILAHFKGLWGTLQSGSQTILFQGKLLELVDKQRANEEALRQRIDDLSRDKDAKQDEIDELRAQIMLLRSQRRRLVDMMRSLSHSPSKPAGAS